MKITITALSVLCLSAASLYSHAQAVMATSGAKITSELPGNHSAEQVGNLNDNNPATKFFIANKTAFWFQYELSQATVINQYTLVSANDMPGRDPKSWILQGSANGSVWVDLDSRKDEVMDHRKTVYTYPVKNKTAYPFYRLKVTESNGLPSLQLAEWNLWVVK